MPAHVLGTIYHPCHPKAASCLSQASFAFHQPQALFPHLWRLCIAALLILNHIFQKRSLVKISMLHRKMIWMPDTSLYTDCGQNKYQRLQWVVPPLGDKGRVGTATLLPMLQHEFYRYSYLIVNVFNFKSDYENNLYSNKWSVFDSNAPFTLHLARVLPIPSSTTLYNVLFSSPAF